MKTKLLAMALLAGSSMFAETRFSIGINVGGYGRGYYAAAPPAYFVERPPCPGPDYFWADGYWHRPVYQSFRRDRDDRYDRNRDRREDYRERNGFRNRY